MTKYKPGQLVTFGKYTYRIKKGIPSGGENGGCMGCILFHLIKDPDHPYLCIQSRENPTEYGSPGKIQHDAEACRKLIREDSFPQFIRINPLCVKN